MNGKGESRSSQVQIRAQLSKIPSWVELDIDCDSYCGIADVFYETCRWMQKQSLKKGKRKSKPNLVRSQSSPAFSDEVAWKKLVDASNHRKLVRSQEAQAVEDVNFLKEKLSANQQGSGLHPTPTVSNDEVEVSDEVALNDPTLAVSDEVALNNPMSIVLKQGKQHVDALNHREKASSHAVQEMNSQKNNRRNKSTRKNKSPGRPRNIPGPCEICGRKGVHFTQFCPWQQDCPPNAKIGVGAEKVCYCCGLRKCWFFPDVDVKNLPGYCVLKFCHICMINGDHWASKCPKAD